MRTRFIQLRLRMRPGPAGWAAALLLAALLFVMGCDAAVQGASRALVFREIRALPPAPVGVVFGAKVLPNGRLSPVLRERVEAGIRLYRAGKVRKLLMTGDNGRVEYDEVTAMKRYAVERGVPAEDVVRDFAGFRTYDSCYRAREIFGIRRAILVTQEYHLYRALYTARGLGIDAVGFAAEPGMDAAAMQVHRRRELLSRIVCLADVALRHPPRLLGPREPLFAGERRDR